MPNSKAAGPLSRSRDSASSQIAIATVAASGYSTRYQRASPYSSGMVPAMHAAMSPTRSFHSLAPIRQMAPSSQTVEPMFTRNA